MPILASSTYVNAYGKSGVIALEARNLDSVLGTTDTFVVKYNSNGRALWTARISSMQNETGGFGIVTDSSGNVYVTGDAAGAGTSTSSGIFNSDGTDFPISIGNSGGGDAFLVKYDTDGFVQWVTRIASSSQDIGVAIAIDSSNNVYLTGRGASGAIITAFNSDGTAFATTLSNDGAEDVFIVKYNTNGFVQWVARIGSTSLEYGNGIATDSSGNVYVTGLSGNGVVTTAYSSNGVAFATGIGNSGGADAFIVKYNTSGIVQWVARVGSSSSDTGNGIATDSSGNVYVTGQGGSGAVVTAYSSNGVAFGTTLPNAGSNDVFIVKYDTNGFVQWLARAATSLSDSGNGIATDSSGNVYVTGQQGSATLTAYNANGTAFGTTLPSSSGTDAFIVKYNTSGSVQWVARVASDQAEIGYGIATDSSGNVYVTGYCNGVAASITTAYNSNGTAFGTTVPTLNGYDAFIVKYNGSGSVQWIARMASSGSDVSRAITVDSGNNIYATGQFAGLSAVIYGQSLSLFSTLPNSGGTDTYIVKYNTNGAPQWVARIASTASDIGYGIATDSSGNVYVTGQGGSAAVVTAYSSNEVAFGTTLPNAGGTDAFIVKYDTGGIVQWVARIASTVGDTGYGIATDSSGNVYVTGQGGNTAVVTAYSSNGVAFSPTIANSNNTDTFIVKYDTGGTVQWVARIASTGADIGYGIATDSSGNVYVTGQGGSSTVVTAYSSNEVAFGTTLANSGSNDAFIVKYDTSGTVQWVARIASTVVDIGYGIATDSSGNVYVTGQGGSGAVVTAYSSNGVAFGTTLPNAGSNDVFIVKYDTNGIVQWVARLASTAADIGYAIATDSGGNVYVAGQNGAGGLVTAFNSDGTGFSPVIPATGTGDVVIVKYNTSGRVQWVAYVSSTTTDTGYALATDSLGNVYVQVNAGSISLNHLAYSSNGELFSRMYGGGALYKYDTNGIGQWGRMIRGTTGVTNNRAVATDGTNNVYITGATASGQITQIYNGDNTVYKILNSINADDCFIVKYSSSATPLWVARLGSVTEDNAYAIATDSSGNIYLTGVAGTTTGTFIASNSDGTNFGTTLPISSGGDTFIAKYNTDGTTQWLARIASTAADAGYGISTDSSGNVYVTGKGGSGAVVTAYSSNGVAFGTTLPNAGGTDAFIVKYDTGGIVQWLARVASIVNENGYAIATDSSGNVYVTGSYGETTTAFSSDGVAFGTTLANSGAADAFIVKYNTSGIVQWVARIVSTGQDVGYGIATDSSGNVYVTGQGGSAAVVTAYSSNEVAFGTTLPNAGSNDAFIVKYNTSGIVQWVARIGSTAADYGYAISTDSSGNVYVAGIYSASPCTAYNANGTAFATTLTNIGSSDGFIAKYDTSGTVQWIARVAATTEDSGYAISTDSSGNVYVAGQGGTNSATVASNADGTLFGSATTASPTNSYIVKYNSTGVVQWISIMSTLTGRSSRAISLDSSGNIYTTGWIVQSSFIASSV